MNNAMVFSEVQAQEVVVNPTAEIVNAYMRNYYFTGEHQYIKYLISTELFFEVLNHLGNAKKRDKQFDFNKAIKKSKTKVKPVAVELFQKWQDKKFDMMFTSLKYKSQLGKLTDAGNEKLNLISEFVPYNIEDESKLKKYLGLENE